jgi:hypothetical protein
MGLAAFEKKANEASDFDPSGARAAVATERGG